MEYYKAKFVKITHYVQKNNLKEIFQTNIEGKVLLLHCVSISALELESLASGCWQVFKVTVFSVHQSVGHIGLICCWHIQKKCFSCSISSVKWLNEKLALFHCAIHGIAAYVMLLPSVIFICMFICYSIWRK